MVEEDSAARAGSSLGFVARCGLGHEVHVSMEWRSSRPSSPRDFPTHYFLGGRYGLRVFLGGLQLHGQWILTRLGV